MFERRLERALALARAGLFWERLWPVLYRVLIVGGLFLALSWLGFWWILPVWLRWVGLAVFAGAITFAARPALKLGWPTRAQGLARLEEAGHYSHHPLATLEDRLATDESDPTVRALWQAHRDRALKALGALKAGWPHPQAFRRDPWGARVIVAMLLVVGFAVSTGDRGARTISAFTGSEAPEARIGRIDAWVTPPAYTRRPPIFLTGDMGPARDPQAVVTVPEGSVVIVRAQGDSRDLKVTFVTGISGAGTSATGQTESDVAPETPRDPNAASDAPLEHRVTLAANGAVEVRRGGATVDLWRFAVEPDENPVISFLGEPEGQLSGTLKLAYEVSDDFGVVSARAVIEPTADATTIAGATGEPHPLYEAPAFPLSLPHRRAREGKGETFKDLTAHPWAGSKVKLTLVATDEAGQEGRSQTKLITLPERRFTKPLARAIVEQRRNLALDANLQPQVVDAMDMLMLAPDEFMDNPKNFLGMKFVYARLNEASGDDELREVADLMWELALSIEDGDLSVAERELRQAQERLRDALERGASDEEIAKLTQELREALQRYMQALAEQLKNNPQAMQPMDPNSQMLRSHDLEEMLRKIEELAKNGARDAARDLLSQMQRMLENLQTGRNQQMPQGRQSQEMMKMLNELADMIRRQQDLMDQTHRQGQQGEDQEGREGQRGQQGQNGQQMTQEQLAEALKRLQEGQNGLAQRLQQLMDQMGKNGMQQPGELGEAGKSMGRAGEALGEGRPGDAVGDQGQALEALRRGAQQLGEQMMGPGGPGGLVRQDGRNNEDPLGRPRRTEGPDYGNRVKVPDDIDIQRARRILEELRRRFSDPERPQGELDYLERLLKRE
ncbi:TIGR02302 family protein [Breoghania corrubedonensis]|uniref:TIGR02302 family protein n=1 Tax=Breoghania corrubedonensis TaxID=665038 RepID=UPI000D3344F9|nr:TIGR02302 family protein [Breoghania corrubedonensis]